MLCAAAWLSFVTDRAPGTSSALTGFPLDDAWIHLVYARSLANEGGFHYNVGVSETGMTSPLWVLTLAPIYRLAAGFGPAAVVISCKLASLFFGLLGLLVLQRLLVDLGESEPAALLATSLTALDPTLAFTTASGMEVGLTVWLTLLALRAATRGDVLTTGLCTGLSVVARPELAALGPIFWLLLLRRVEGPSRRRRLATAGVLTLLPALLWSCFCLTAAGRLLPNSFYAKFLTPGPEVFGRVATAWSANVSLGMPAFALGLGLPLLALGGVRLVKRSGLAGTAFCLTGGVLFLCVAISRRWLPASYFYYARWLAPASPFLLTTLALGIVEVGSGLRSFRPRIPVVLSRWPPFPIAFTIALVGVAFPYANALSTRAATYAWNCQNVDEVQVALGRFIDKNLPQRSTLAVSDAGALRYFGNRRTMDMLGLNDHLALARLANGNLAVPAAADYVAIFPFQISDIERDFRPIAFANAPHYTISGPLQQTTVLYARLPRTESPLAPAPQR